MTDLATQTKWDKNAKTYEWAGMAAELRWKPEKKALFEMMGRGSILFVAVGPGVDFKLFPPNRKIIGVDISPKMLELAQKKVPHYSGELELRQMDVQALEFEDNSFDQVFTSCTFCSVPDPVKGLNELRRVLKPGGDLKMFEHTGSQYFPFRQMLALMNPIAEKFGPSVNRNTLANVQNAGFVIHRVKNIYLDIVKTIEAMAP